MLMKQSKKIIATTRMAWACILLFGCALAYADSTGEILKASPEQHDFGTIPEGDPAVAKAIIENISGSPVEITNVRTS